MEKTFVMIKGDGVKRGLMGEIIKRIEQKEFHINQIKLLRPSRDIVEEHYKEHKGKPFFEELVTYITGGPVLIMEVEGEDAVDLVRKLMGDKDPHKALPGTIRGDFSHSTTQNIIHGSDSTESAVRELAIWFKES
ncbi:MAG: nucleoside-diphosphate kinase [Cellulosilyticaceae bacterium]